MKPAPRFVILDASNTMTLGQGNTEKEAVEQATKYLSGPKRVTIHDSSPNGYKRRNAIIDGDGLVSK